MGLDMFLEKAMYADKDTKVLTEKIYWRKAYPIMDWFENHYEGVVNCARYSISLEGLGELYDFVKECIETDLAKLDEINTEWCDAYNMEDWYMEDLKYTKVKLEELFKEAEEDTDWSYAPPFYIFHAWW